MTTAERSAERSADPDLAELETVTAQLAAAERLAAALREWRDRLLIEQAAAGKPHADLGAAADLTVQGVGKVTRRAGLGRYRPRSGANDGLGWRSGPRFARLLRGRAGSRVLSGAASGDAGSAKRGTRSRPARRPRELVRPSRPSGATRPCRGEPSS